MNTDDLVATRPLPVTSRFQLAAPRLADAWLRAGRIRVSPEEFRIAREFLERDGWTVEELPGVRVRLRHPGFSGETTREEAVVVALRRLVVAGRSLALSPEERRGGTAPRSAALVAPISFRISEPAGTAGDACPAGWLASPP